MLTRLDWTNSLKSKAHGPVRGRMATNSNETSHDIVRSLCGHQSGHVIRIQRTAVVAATPVEFNLIRDDCGRPSVIAACVHACVRAGDLDRLEDHPRCRRRADSRTITERWRARRPVKSSVGWRRSEGAESLDRQARMTRLDTDTAAAAAAAVGCQVQLISNAFRSRSTNGRLRRATAKTAEVRF
jgi:hypothetical protein